MPEIGFNPKAISGPMDPQGGDVGRPVPRNALVSVVPIKPGVETLMEIVRLPDVERNPRTEGKG